MANLNALFATLSVATLLGFASTMTEAGPYGDDLGKCFVNSTTPSDKRALVKWMFATAALHPDLALLTAVLLSSTTLSIKPSARCSSGC